jgi:hypothetical protein
MTFRCLLNESECESAIVSINCDSTSC